jgi:hypothetical protein
MISVTFDPLKPITIALILKVDRVRENFDLDGVAFEINLFAIYSRSTLAASIVEGCEGLSGLSLEEESGCVASELTEDTSTNAR